LPVAITAGIWVLFVLKNVVMDMEAFSCIGYKLCESNFEESHDYISLSAGLKKRHEGDFRITRAGDFSEDESALYIFFETMFKDGVYLAGNQTHLDSIIKKEKLKVIGDFQHYAVLDCY
jgi:hypothetical protein